MDAARVGRGGGGGTKGGAHPRWRFSGERRRWRAWWKGPGSSRGGTRRSRGPPEPQTLISRNALASMVLPRAAWWRAGGSLGGGGRRFFFVTSLSHLLLLNCFFFFFLITCSSSSSSLFLCRVYYSHVSASFDSFSARLRWRFRGQCRLRWRAWLKAGGSSGGGAGRFFFFFFFYLCFFLLSFILSSFSFLLPCVFFFRFLFFFFSITLIVFLLRLIRLLLLFLFLEGGRFVERVAEQVRRPS